MGHGEAGPSRVECGHHSQGFCSSKLLLPSKAELLLRALPSDDIGAGFTCLLDGEAPVVTVSGFLRSVTYEP